MRTLIFCCALTLLALMQVQCGSGTPPQPTRLLDCYVRILETEGNVLAEATLKESQPGANPKPVEVPGGLRYQGSPMDVRPQQGLTYRTEFAGVYRPDHTFSWDDEQKKRHTFTATMGNVSNYSFGSNTLTLGQPATCRWEGEPLQAGETLVFFWENLTKNQAVPMEIYGGNGQPEINFPAAQLSSKLSPGKWALYLVRKRLVKANAGGTPCQAILEFYSQTDTLTIQ